MKIIKIKYGLEPPTYVTVTPDEVRRAFSSEKKYKKFINEIKEVGETHARPISIEDYKKFNK